MANYGKTVNNNEIQLDSLKNSNLYFYLIN